MACASARAEVAAYSDCTEAQMMAMFGWRDHKMPALYIAKASLDKLAISGMEKIQAYDQMENTADLAMPIDQNRIVIFESNRRKKCIATAGPTPDAYEKALIFQRRVWGGALGAPTTTSHAVEITYLFCFW
jgi:hypothetical protein